MAKKDNVIEAEAIPQTGQEIAPIKTGSLIADDPTAKINFDVLAGDAEDEGFDKQDLAIPFLRMLQKGSPAVNKHDPLYVEGAEVGNFHLTVMNKLWKEECFVLPVVYQRSYIEWKPRADGGGFIKDWGSDESIKNKCTRNELGRDITPNGNELVTSGLYYIMIVDLKTGQFDQAALSLSSTQLKRSRKWNTLMSNVTVPGPNGPMRPPMFFTCWRLTPEYEKNDKGDWMSFGIEAKCSITAIPNGEHLYMAAREFKRMINEGSAKAAVDQTLEEHTGASGDSVPF